ncbi:MAG: encapsulin [Acetivibrionales bacterium]|jgi:hypothetical protein
MTNALATFSKKIESQLVDPLRQINIGRKLVYVTPAQGFGISSVEWGKITEMSEGYVSYGFTSGNEDMIDVTLTNNKIPVYWKDYKVPRRMYESWKVNGTDIDNAAALSAGYQTVSAEDMAIIQGVKNDGTHYDILGLYQGAGADYSTSSDFGTWGNAIKALAGAKTTMASYGVPAYNMPLNMVLGFTNYGQLESSVHSTSGQLEKPIVESMLNGGAIYAVPDTILPDSDGLVLPTPAAGKAYFDFYLTQNYTVEHGIDSEHPDTGDLTGRVYSAGILRIKQDKAICKISVI